MYGLTPSRLALHHYITTSTTARQHDRLRHYNTTTTQHNNATAPQRHSVTALTSTDTTAPHLAHHLLRHPSEGGTGNLRRDGRDARLVPTDTGVDDGHALMHAVYDVVCGAVYSRSVVVQS